MTIRRKHSSRAQRTILLEWKQTLTEIISGTINITAFGITIPIAPEHGGGCVASGPFAKHNITLGPVAFGPAGPVTTPAG